MVEFVLGIGILNGSCGWRIRDGVLFEVMIHGFQLQIAHGFSVLFPRLLSTNASVAELIILSGR